MSAARDQILARIRAGLSDVPAGEQPADVAVPRDYRRRSDDARAALVERFVERVLDYHASVSRIATPEIGGAVRAACIERGLTRLAVPPDLPAGWRPKDIDVSEDHGLTSLELDAIDGALTGCSAAIAETGTIILDAAGACGRRALTLVPDHHICVVTEDQIVGIVPEGLARIADQTRPITLISGPSATSDIELQRVEGVHGPRTLIVLIATEPD